MGDTPNHCKKIGCPITFNEATYVCSEFCMPYWDRVDLILHSEISKSSTPDEEQNRSDK